MNERRSKIEIAAAILRVASGENGALKSHIVYKANLNFNCVNPYLADLKRQEMLKESMTGRRVFTTTAKGLEFIAYVDGLQDYLN